MCRLRWARVHRMFELAPLDATRNNTWWSNRQNFHPVQPARPNWAVSTQLDLMSDHQSPVRPDRTYSYGSQPYPAWPQVSPQEFLISRAPVVTCASAAVLVIVTLSS